MTTANSTDNRSRLKEVLVSQREAEIDIWNLEELWVPEGQKSKTIKGSQGVPRTV